MEFILLPGLFFIIYSLGASASDVVVHLENGSVRGEKMTGERGNVFYSFRSIPYAEPPVGNLRFKPPVPKRPWKEEIDATKEAPMCSQRHILINQYTGKEDCLYLNVYTPKIPENNDGTKLDVLFHIHGGGFKLCDGGSSLFGPFRMPLDEMIMVSPNYRLGPLGFLSTNDSSSPGNYGLLDQVEALRWVRNNIHHFGGDPDRVTILGVSAGGASVIYQMLSPLSEGLFQRAVSMSGSPLNPWGLQKDPVYWATRLAKDVNCPIETSEEMVACLRGKTAEELIAKGDHKIMHSDIFPFAPTVDGYFIEDHPLDILKEGKYNKNVPLIMGATRDEGNCWFLMGRKGSTKDYTEDEILDTLKTSVDLRPNIDDVIERVKDKYFSNLNSYNYEEVEKLLGKAITDGMFHSGIYQTVKLMVEADTETYFYRYDFEMVNPFFEALLKTSGNYGVCHGIDITMLFKGTLMAFPLPDPESEKMMKIYQKLMLNFINRGNPTITKDDDICEWPAAQPNKLHQYHIDKQCSVDVYDETKDEMYTFWTQEIPHLYSKNKLSHKEEL
uniref:Carboxylic ester hydrolase n=1 Tax=Scolopendra viridis TaxID=118503 RepID=A0A4D5RA63_SCOVI